MKYSEFKDVVEKIWFMSNARNMTIGVLTRDSVYKSIKQAITKNIGLEITEVTE